jgi:hypothetical protein
MWVTDGGVDDDSILLQENKDLQETPGGRGGMWVISVGWLLRASIL